jgi:outer membrane lipoprotein-sorting protein
MIANTLRMKKALLSLLLLSVSAFSFAARQSNSAIAKQILDKTLKLVQNPGGVEMNYNLKITFLYSQSGAAIIKGGKTLTSTKKTKVWFNGVTGWWLERKDNTVTVFDSKYKKHIGLGKQEYIAEHGCTYEVTNEKRGYLLRLRTKDPNLSIHEATILVDRNTYAPLQLRFKWKIFWIAVDISNFRVGNFNDNIFEFNYKAYPGVKIVDKRNEE